MVKLINDYCLSADKYQYIVGRLKERKRGDRTTTELIEQTYHPTLAAAVAHVADEVLRGMIADGEFETLKNVVDAYQEISEALVEQLDAAPRELRKKVNALDH